MTSAKILLVGMTNQAGGAERVLNELSSLEGASLHVLRTSTKNTLFQPHSHGLWKVLFGDTDILHTHLFWPGFFAALKKFWNPGLRWVHTVHYADYAGLKHPHLYQFLDKNFIFPRASKLVFVSEAAKKSFAAYAKSEVISNDVNLNELQVPNHPFDPSAPVIGCVAMLREEKGLEDLIAIFAEFHKKHPKARLKIAGDGPLRDRLQKYSADLNIEASVEFCGYQSDLRSFFSSIDIYAQPSLSESFGLAIFESLCFARPIVGAAVGNIPSILKNEFGQCIDRDENFRWEYVKALENICADYKYWQRAAQQGFYFWKEQLKPGTMLARYAEIYDQLLRPGVCMLAPIVTHAKGGLQQQLFLQTKTLAEKGYRVFVLQNKDPKLDLQSEHWKHVEFLQVRLPQFIQNQRIKGIIYLLGGIRRVFQQRKNIQICHAHQLYSPTLVGVWAKIFFKKPLVVKVTASGSLGELSELQRLPFFGLRKRAFQYIDRVFALTESMREEVLQLGISPDKVMVLPNSVQLPDFKLQNYSLLGDATHLLFVGRLSKEKSIDTLLLAADILAKKGHRIVVDLVGSSYKDRDVTENLKKMAAGFSSSVEIKFWGERKDVQRFYEAQPLFILPSASEGMSNSLLEALSYGMLCVASDIAANKFLIKDGENGLLFKQGEPTSLAEVLEKLIMDRQGSSVWSQSLQKKARQTIENQFSTEIIGQRISDVYQALINKTINKPIKVLRLFSRLNVGGPALHVVNLTYGLEKYGYSTQLIVGSISSDEGDMSYYARQKGVQPKVIKSFQAPISLKKDLMSFWHILKIVHKEKPDIIHTHTFKAGLLGRLAGFIFRTPYRIHTYHGHLFEGYGGQLKTKIIEAVERSLGLLSHKVLSVSDLVAKDLLKHKIVPEKKLQVVELGFDIDPFLKEALQPSSLRKLLKLEESDVLIGIAGRLVPVKSVDLFLRAVTPVLEKYPQVHVAVIGDGPERCELEKLASTLHSRIHFTGWMLPLHPELKDLDLLVCSSRNEGTSVSVIEAILCEVPVISTHVGGMADLLEYGRWGDLVPYDENELRDKILERVCILINKNSDKYQGLKVRSVAAKNSFYERFHLSRLLKDINQIYQSAMTKKSSSKLFSNQFAKVQSTPKFLTQSENEFLSTESKAPENLL